MRDYTKQNKAVFLWNGRCVFESDAPRYEAEIERETLSSRELPLLEEMAVYKGWVDRVERELPEAPKSTQRKNCETCYYDRGVRCHKMEIASINNNGLLLKKVVQWAVKNTSVGGKPVDGADNCPGWKGREE